jgi:hypothetical protein
LSSNCRERLVYGFLIEAPEIFGAILYGPSGVGEISQRGKFVGGKGK